MSGEAFGTNSRFHPGRAEECDPHDVPMQWAYGPNGDDWTSTASVAQVAATTGMTHDEVREALTGLERKGLLNRIAA